MEEEGVVPASAFDLAAGGALVGIGAQEIEGEAAQPGEVFRGVVLVHDHVEHPVELVFDLQWARTIWATRMAASGLESR